jgi:hypothetical protein
MQPPFDIDFNSSRQNKVVVNNNLPNSFNSTAASVSSSSQRDSMVIPIVIGVVGGAACITGLLVFFIKTRSRDDGSRAGSDKGSATSLPTVSSHLPDLAAPTPSGRLPSLQGLLAVFTGIAPQEQGPGGSSPLPAADLRPQARAHSCPLPRPLPAGTDSYSLA